MSKLHGQFFWYDLMTTDCKAAQAFYGKVIGWDAKDSGVPGQTYTILSTGPTMVGGLMPITKEASDMGARPCWTGYIAVDDVDTYAERVKGAGGKVLRAPLDIPGILRFAVVADPHGAPFIIFRGFSEETPQPPAPGTPGCIGWHELQAGDLERDFAFYAELFGWRKLDVVPSPVGPYQLFSTGEMAAGGMAVGGMMPRRPEAPGPFWLYYVNVRSIDAAVRSVQEGGGQVCHGPMEVPGGSWIAQCMDPQGAMFAMVGAKA